MIPRSIPFVLRGSMQKCQDRQRCDAEKRFTSVSSNILRTPTQNEPFARSYSTPYGECLYPSSSNKTATHRHYHKEIKSNPKARAAREVPIFSVLSSTNEFCADNIYYQLLESKRRFSLATDSAKPQKNPTENSANCEKNLEWPGELLLKWNNVMNKSFNLVYNSEKSNRDYISSGSVMSEDVLPSQGKIPIQSKDNTDKTINRYLPGEDISKKKSLSYFKRKSFISASPVSTVENTDNIPLSTSKKKVNRQSKFNSYSIFNKKVVGNKLDSSKKTASSDGNLARGIYSKYNVYKQNKKYTKHGQKKNSKSKLGTGLLSLPCPERLNNRSVIDKLNLTLETSECTALVVYNPKNNLVANNSQTSSFSNFQLQDEKTPRKIGLKDAELNNQDIGNTINSLIIKTHPTVNSVKCDGFELPLQSQSEILNLSSSSDLKKDVLGDRSIDTNKFLIKLQIDSANRKIPHDVDKNTIDNESKSIFCEEICCDVSDKVCTMEKSDNKFIIKLEQHIPGKNKSENNLNTSDSDMKPASFSLSKLKDCNEITAGTDKVIPVLDSSTCQTNNDLHSDVKYFPLHNSNYESNLNVNVKSCDKYCISEDAKLSSNLKDESVTAELTNESNSAKHFDLVTSDIKKGKCLDSNGIAQIDSTFLETSNAESKMSTNDLNDSESQINVKNIDSQSITGKKKLDVKSSNYESIAVASSHTVNENLAWSDFNIYIGYEPYPLGESEYPLFDRNALLNEQNIIIKTGNDFKNVAPSVTTDLSEGFSETNTGIAPLEVNLVQDEIGCSKNACVRNQNVSSDIRKYYLNSKPNTTGLDLSDDNNNEARRPSQKSELDNSKFETVSEKETPDPFIAADNVTKNLEQVLKCEIDDSNSALLNDLNSKLGCDNIWKDVRKSLPENSFITVPKLKNHISILDETELSEKLEKLNIKHSIFPFSKPPNDAHSGKALSLSFKLEPTINPPFSLNETHSIDKNKTLNSSTYLSNYEPVESLNNKPCIENTKADQTSKKSVFKFSGSLLTGNSGRSEQKTVKGHAGKPSELLISRISPHKRAQRKKECVAVGFARKQYCRIRGHSSRLTGLKHIDMGGKKENIHSKAEDKLQVIPVNNLMTDLMRKFRRLSEQMLATNYNKVNVRANSKRCNYKPPDELVTSINQSKVDNCVKDKTITLDSADGKVHDGHTSESGQEAGLVDPAIWKYILFLRGNRFQLKKHSDTIDIRENPDISNRSVLDLFRSVDKSTVIIQKDFYTKEKILRKIKEEEEKLKKIPLNKTVKALQNYSIKSDSDISLNDADRKDPHCTDNARRDSMILKSIVEPSARISADQIIIIRKNKVLPVSSSVETTRAVTPYANGNNDLIVGASENMKNVIILEKISERQTTGKDQRSDSLLNEPAKVEFIEGSSLSKDKSNLGEASEKSNEHKSCKITDDVDSDSISCLMESLKGLKRSGLVKKNKLSNRINAGSLLIKLKKDGGDSMAISSYDMAYQLAPDNSSTSITQDADMVSLHNKGYDISRHGSTLANVPATPKEGSSRVKPTQSVSLPRSSSSTFINLKTEGNKTEVSIAQNSNILEPGESIPSIIKSFFQMSGNSAKMKDHAGIVDAAKKKLMGLEGLGSSGVSGKDNTNLDLLSSVRSCSNVSTGAYSLVHANQKEASLRETNAKREYQLGSSTKPQSKFEDSENKVKPVVEVSNNTPSSPVINIQLQLAGKHTKINHVVDAEETNRDKPAPPPISESYEDTVEKMRKKFISNTFRPDSNIAVNRLKTKSDHLKSPKTFYEGVKDVEDKKNNVDNYEAKNFDYDPNCNPLNEKDLKLLENYFYAKNNPNKKNIKKTNSKYSLGKGKAGPKKSKTDQSGQVIDSVSKFKEVIEKYANENYMELSQYTYSVMSPSEFANAPRPSTANKVCPVTDVSESTISSFSLLNNKKLEFVKPSEGIINIDLLANPRLKEKYGSVPSVSRILNDTMSESSKKSLEKWKMRMVSAMGESKFQEFYKEQLDRGKTFHESIKDYLMKKSDIGQKFNENLCCKSVEWVLKDVTDVAALESFIVHPSLGYKGIFDCIAKYKEKPVLIEWKHSSRRKSKLDSTYDAPLQLTAYMGALAQDINYNFQVDAGLIVVAHTDGSPAEIFEMDSNQCQKYWSLWLKRLSQYIANTRGENVSV